MPDFTFVKRFCSKNNNRRNLDFCVYTFLDTFSDLRCLHCNVFLLKFKSVFLQRHVHSFSSNVWINFKTTKRLPTAPNSSDTCDLLHRRQNGLTSRPFYLNYTKIATTQWKKESRKNSRTPMCRVQQLPRQMKNPLSGFISVWVKRLNWSHSHLSAQPLLRPADTELLSIGLTGLSTQWSVPRWERTGKKFQISCDVLSFILF